MDVQQLNEFVTNHVQESMASLKKLAAHKCLSPIYNSNWESDGDLTAALKEVKEYVESLKINGLLNSQILQSKGVTPAYYFTVEPTDEDEPYTILFYSHVDKIPFGTGWSPNKNPEKPAIIDGLLYGRGVSNGCYAIFTLAAAIQAIQAQNQKHPRLVVLIETSKESGSVDLTEHLTSFVSGIVEPNLIVCLNGEIPTYDYMCYVTSMKGQVVFDADIHVLTRAVHSGGFGGLSPDSLTVFDMIMNKIESINGNKVTMPLLDEEVTEEETAKANEIASLLGETFYQNVPTVQGLKLLGDSTSDIYINSVYKPSFNLIGIEKIPNMANAAASLRPATLFRCCFRLPAKTDVSAASETIKKAFTEDTPYQAGVEIKNYKLMQGATFPIADKMKAALEKTSTDVLDVNKVVYWDNPGTSPHMQIFNALFPDANVLCTGVANMIISNIRGAEENLSLAYYMKVTKNLSYFISLYNDYKN
jgi:acetylornithine deacetylase/succinyl-diaminopimelate desuccinylase-like protein